MLPPEFGRLKALDHLSLRGNRLTTPPEEVAAQGAEAIVAFMAGVAANGRQLHEAKVVLVGEGAVGKTSLRGWLLDGRFVKPGDSTRGLEIGTRECPHPGLPGKLLRMNVWDFGGQDEYRPSQQLFFTTGALYLVLFKGREGLAQGRVEDWMRLIRHRAGEEARVLLVATHMRETDPTPSLAAIPDDLRVMIIDPTGTGSGPGVFEIDSPSGYGTKALMHRVIAELTNLPGFSAQWPGTWLDARDAILARRMESSKRRAYLPYTDVMEICEREGISTDCAAIIARTMSLQGRIDYHGDGEDLNQLVILDPEWLLKAIAYVLADKPTKQNNGVLTADRLDPIWLNHKRPETETPERYERHLWKGLLDLMAEHEILYRLNSDDCVVAQLVPEAPAVPAGSMWTCPDGPTDSEPDALPAVRLHCALDGKIRGLMSLLIVRNHFHHVDHQRYFWQRGVFLRAPVEGAVDAIAIDKEWWAATRKWLPIAALAGSAVAGAFGIPISFGAGDVAGGIRDAMSERERQDDDAEPSGVLVRPDGQHLPQAFKEELIRIAKMGGMEQVQMDSTGRWMWVSPEIAKRAKRTEPKE